MTPAQKQQGEAELRAARRDSRGLFWAAGIFSVFVNILVLTGPLYMLQVYDRVLSSRSEATLLAITLIMAFLFAMMGLLDYARGRVLAEGSYAEVSKDARVIESYIGSGGAHG